MNKVDRVKQIIKEAKETNREKNSCSSGLQKQHSIMVNYLTTPCKHIASCGNLGCYWKRRDQFKSPAFMVPGIISAYTKNIIDHLGDICCELPDLYMSGGTNVAYIYCRDFVIITDEIRELVSEIKESMPEEDILLKYDDDSKEYLIYNWSTQKTEGKYKGE